MLGDRQQESLILFVNFIAALCAPTQDLSKLESLKEQVQTALARLESDFPLSLQVYFQIIQGNYFRKDVSYSVFLLFMIRVWVWVWFTCLQKYHYNKAPLIWLAMVTYWRKNNHELYQLIWKNLVIFDEYLLENAHISDQRK